MLSGRWIAPLLLAAGAVAAQEAPPEPLRPALTASIEVLDDGGRALDPVPPGEPFQLAVSVRNHAGPEPPAGLRLAGWLRRVSARNLPCHQAARAFFSTGSLPTDAVSLNGPVLGVLSEEGSFTVVDPAISLASANLIGAATLPEQPAALAAAPLWGGFLVSLPAAGEVRALTAFGARSRVVAGGLDRPTTLIADGAGGVWVLEEGAARISRFDGGGHKTATLAAVALSGDAATILFRDGAGGLQVLDAATATPLAVLPPAPDATAEALLPGPDGPVAVLRLTKNRLAVHYLDAPDSAREIALASPVARLAVDPAGRLAFAWDPAGGPVSVIDLARGHLARTVGAHGSAISEVVVLDRMAVLLRADQSEAATLALDSIRPGTEPQLGAVPLGAAASRPVTEPGFLLAVPGGSEALAIHAQSFTGFVVGPTSAIGAAPPMASVRLRGGVPRTAAILARGFSETGPGRYRAGAVIPGPGRYELVLSTGVGGLTLCHEIPTLPLPGAQAPAARIAAEVDPVPAADGSRQVTLRIVGPDGLALPGVAGVLSVAALETGWLQRADWPERDERGSGMTLRLPARGTFVVTLSGADSAGVPPLVMELGP
ncbi:hypothetical protein [Paracoccus sp. MC1862]|uniref:hypothetical protein n=1 Tax=Paracoccus sp. MC1862 TaxID=2760307 RepID=UPI001601F8D1|nr:hypothetical protein [Paracoccus sp. MC1862]MBB1498548.1 hypothetical protein [Paracoccus sp. MC1862]QQO44196.1 hypothetical protein JGR78_12460 [Paracoccus sp. MC1862]